MNFPGPFNSDLASATAISLDSEHFTFLPQPMIGSGHSKADGIVVPDKHLLFCGDYARDGNDLILSDANQNYVVHDYFKGEKRPALVSEDGAMLSGHIVSSLTGHVQYAQTTAPDAAQIVGHVMKMTGSASVVRNGVAVELHIGDAVQKGDVIQTGSDSTVAMTLIDGSAFGMTSNARMVLNEMVYDPNGSSNSSFISLVQGTVTFVAGQTAKNGNMRVETPVATMGIRGTAVLVKIYSDTGVVETSLGVEPDGHVGGYAFYDNVTGALLGTVTQAGRVTIISPGGVGQPAVATEQPLTPQAVQADKILFNQVYQLYFPNFNPDDSKPKSTDHPRTDIGIPPTILGKLGTDADTGRPSITYTISVTNPDTHVTSNINIVYVNTPPSFSVTNVQDIQAIVLGTNSFKLGDQVVITDPDINIAPFFDVATPYVANSGALANAIGPSTIVFGSYLYNTNLVSFDQATGLVTYNPEGFRFLAEGETAIYKFTFTASSGVGSSGSDSAGLTLLLTITGENDAPMIVAGSTTATGGVIEDDTPDVSHNIKTSGLITFQDFDLTDAHHVTVNGGLAAAVGPTTVAPTSTSISVPLPGFDTNTASLGTFTILPVAENLTDTNDTGTVGWNFVLDNNDTKLQSLAEGQTITQTYTITITDSHGVTTDQIVTVTITGTNDQPVISVGTTDTAAVSISETVSETGQSTPDSATGTLSFSDVDLTDTHQANATLHANGAVWSATNGASGIPLATINAINLAMTAAISTGVVGSDSTDTGAGTLTWSFSLADHFLDFLRVNETLTLTYDVFVTDDSGTASNASAPQQVVVTLTATNDVPVITAGAATTLSEAIGQTGQTSPAIADNGVLTFTDTDLDDAHTFVTPSLSSAVWTLANHTVATVPSLTLAEVASGSTFAVGLTDSTGLGSGSLDWHFSLADFFADFLAVGDTLTLTYDVTIKDDSGDTGTNTSLVQQVVITITGTNDAPTIVVTNPMADVEGNAGTPAPVTVTVADFVSITDVDIGDLHTPYVAGTLVYGSSTGPAPTSGTLADLFTVNATNGTVSYDKAAFDYLSNGETVSATFTFNASSGPDTLQKSITITIDGVNDAPVAVTDTITNDTPPSAAGWVLNPDNGHYYRYVDGAGYATWTDAQATAATDGGYLATVTSSQESSFVYNLIANHTFGGTWLGGYGPVAADASSWYWVSGPEQGVHFTYTNWDSVYGEPNGDINHADAGLNINPDGTWNDVPTSENDHFGGFGYVEEWGGQVGQVVFREDTGTTLTTQQLLANDTDVDNTASQLSITAVSAASAHGGTVSLDGNIITYHPATDYNGADSFTYTLSDGSLTSTGTVSFNVAAVNDAPDLIGDGISTVQVGPTMPDYGTITKVIDLSLSDSDEGNALSTVSAVADHGAVTYFDGMSDVSLATGVSATVTGVNAIFHDGITYTPNGPPSIDNTDKLTVTVTDSHGASDTINFIFQQAGAPDATQLTGTTGKDLIFATEHNDTLFGDLGRDNFVFASTTGQHVVTDFTQGQDRVDLHITAAPTDNAALGVWLNLNAVQMGADTILYLDVGHTAQNEVVLQNVTLNNLTSNDFIIHA